jgi:hypothetical protein
MSSRFAIFFASCKLSDVLMMIESVRKLSSSHTNLLLKNVN